MDCKVDRQLPELKDAGLIPAILNLEEVLTKNIIDLLASAAARNLRLAGGIQLVRGFGWPG
jgi:hypothetical protein